MWSWANISLRPQQEADDRFVEELVLATREEEVGYRELSPADRNRLLAEQNRLQQEHYRQVFPQCHFLIVEADSKPIGRFYLDHRPTTIHAVELSLLPSLQGNGIGSQLIKTVQAEATRQSITVTLSVVVGSPAIQFYRRLGFQITGTSETHHQMRWSPPRQ